MLKEDWKETDSDLSKNVGKEQPHTTKKIENIDCNTNEIINCNNHKIIYMNNAKEKRIIFQTSPAFNIFNDTKNFTKSIKSDIISLNSAPKRNDSDVNSPIKMINMKKQKFLDQSQDCDEIKNLITDKLHSEIKFEAEGLIDSDSVDDNHYKTGRWQPDEHVRFIEAIMTYGNAWKMVQKHVGSRSSTQTRSHAQKFFVKIKRTNLLDFNIDLNKNSISNLHEAANSMNGDEYLKTIKTLNNIAFEKKSTTFASNIYPDNKSIHQSAQSSNMKNAKASTEINTNNLHTDDFRKFASYTNFNFSNNFSQSEPSAKNNEGPINLLSEKNISQPRSSNVKILSFSDNSNEIDTNFKSSYNKPNPESAKNIIINNNYNNYNILINSENCDQINQRNLATMNTSSLFNNNFIMKKTQRENSNDNIFNNNLYDVLSGNNAFPKFKNEDDFYCGNFYNSGNYHAEDYHLNLNLNNNMNVFSFDNYLNFNNNNPNFYNSNLNQNSKDTLNVRNFEL